MEHVQCSLLQLITLNKSAKPHLLSFKEGSGVEALRSRTPWGGAAKWWLSLSSVGVTSKKGMSRCGALAAKARPWIPVDVLAKRRQGVEGWAAGALGGRDGWGG